MPPHASPLKSPASTFSLAIDKTAQMDALNSIDFLPIAFRPIKVQPFHLETRGAYGSTFSLWKTNAQHGFVSAPKYVVEKMTIRVVTRGKIVRRNQKGEIFGQSGQAMFVAFEDMVNEEVSPLFEALSGTFDQSMLLTFHCALEGEDVKRLPQYEPIIDIVTPPLRAFAHNFGILYDRLCAGIDTNDLVYPLLSEMVMYQFLTVWPKLSIQPPLTGKAGPSRHLRRAIDYIDANLARRLTVAEVATAAGLGVRSLQLGFHKEIGKSPIQFILDRRLSHVQMELLSSSQNHRSIADIARQWGFVHMSDFARRYRDRYGYNPVDTRK